MRAIEILTELKARGVTLQPMGDRLRVGPRERVPDQLVAELRTHKSELIDLLTWPKECVAAERKFGRRIARLFPLVGRQVSTPLGDGRLIAALPERALVILDRQPDRLTVLLPAEVGPPEAALNGDTPGRWVH